MPDTDTLQSGRNAFVAVILVLLAVGLYQVVTTGSVSPAVGATWVVGVVVYYGSTWYYGRGG